VASLGGRFVRPQPRFHVTLSGPAGTDVKLALLDTGSDDTVFPESSATQIGLDLRGAPAATASGVGLVPFPVRYAVVTLRVTDGKEFREWPAWVGFTPAPLRRPLLGFASFLQFFTATFHGGREQVELAVNSLYPGR
jgi:predicted aspartyl protease